MPRRVTKLFNARQQSEGAGFIVRRPIGSGELSDAEADPFLLLDELGPKTYLPGEFAGAPWHPHRGFHTVTYLKKGQGTHSDSMGNTGTLYAGDLQWMTAASGIEHDEGRGHPGGELHGFQLWVNIPKAHKMDPPAYQDVPSAKIPCFDVAPGVRVKVLAGECGGVPAVVQTKVPVQYLDFTVSPGASYSHPVPETMATCFCYVSSGTGTFGPQARPAGQGAMVVFSADGGEVSFTGGDQELSFLLLAGQPIREPVARQGPFVMNTRAELETAFREYQNGTFIKEKATMRTNF